MRIAVVLISFLILLSCKEEASHATTAKPHAPARTLMLSKDLNMPVNYDSYGNVSFITQGPRGGVLIDANGKKISYRVFRIQIANDTTCSVELSLKLPASSIRLLPDTNQYFWAFVFPDSVTPATLKDTFDFGIDVGKYLDTYSQKVSQIKTIVKPKSNRFIYVGIINGGPDDRTRSVLFLKGHDPKLPFLPTIPTSMPQKKPQLMLGVGTGPANHYAIIECGQMVFKKQD